MTNIAQVAVGVINLIDDGRFIYSIAANAMDSVESKNRELSGADKKASVLAFVEYAVCNIVEKLGCLRSLNF